MHRHPLDALLSPRSIAFVGASARPNTPGHDMMRMIRTGGFGGTVFAVNPNYTEIEGFPCVPDLHRLPSPPDLAVLAVKNERLEDAMQEAIAGRREGGGDLRVGAARRTTSRPVLCRAARRDGAQRRHAGVRPELHGLLQRPRQCLDLRLPEPAAPGAWLDRPDRAFGQRVRRARTQRSALALRARDFTRTGAHRQHGRLHQLRGGPAGGAGRRHLHRDGARSRGFPRGAGEGGRAARFPSLRSRSGAPKRPPGRRSRTRARLRGATRPIRRCSTVTACCGSRPSTSWPRH